MNGVVQAPDYILFMFIHNRSEISREGGDNMKFPGDKRTVKDIVKDINTTLERCGIDKRLIIVKR